MSSYQDLLDAVRKHSGMDDEQLREAGEHGADAGWPGFTYYADTCAFTESNRALIWDLLAKEADDFGYGSALELVASFSTKADDQDGLDNLVAWWALETVGRMLVDGSLGDDDDESDES